MPRSRALTILTLLTIFAGVIRFTHLEHPCLWYDESMVFWRTCGSYGQLLDCLRTDGFVPLHYSLIWVITRVFRPTPFVLRFIPALCGTLMVPAVYFLARQLLQRRTSLLAAAFTACSAFMLFYSRDAKMYMDAWLFVTLNIACLLWWFRTGKSTAWLCWIASGCAACGVHFSSAIPVAISVLLLLTQKTVRWQMVLLWTLGVIVILAGPVGYYEKFNTWKDRADQNWSDSGLKWIHDYNAGRTDAQLVRFLSTSTVMGWEWPKDADTDPHLRNPAPVKWPARGAWAVFGMLILAAPWPRKWRQTPVLRYSLARPPAATKRSTTETRRARRRKDRAIFSFFSPCPPCLRGESSCRKNKKSHDILEEPDSASTSTPTDPALRSTSEPASAKQADDLPPEPQWRIALWLSFLIVIPVYTFYCFSVPQLASPLDGWNLLIEHIPFLAPFLAHPLAHPWMLLIAEIAAVALICLLAIYYSGFVRGLQMLQVIAAILGLCQLIALNAPAFTSPEKSFWVPRYIGFIWPALAVAVAALIMRLPTRPVRIIAICFLLSLNLGIASFRIFGQTEPPVDLMAADAFYAENPEHHTLAWMNLQQGAKFPGGENLFNGPGEYYLDLLNGKPTSPAAFEQAIDNRMDGMKPWSVPWYRDLPVGVDRIIIWNQDEPNPTHPRPDRPAPAGWKLIDEQWDMARDCWIWRDLFRYHRAVWQRQNPNDETRMTNQ